MTRKSVKHPGDQRARDLILWARAEGVVLTRIRVGDVEVELADTRIAAPRGKVKTDAQLEADFYRKYGGKALEQFEAQVAAEPEGEAESADANMHAAEDDEDAPG